MDIRGSRATKRLDNVTQIIDGLLRFHLGFEKKEIIVMVLFRCTDHIGKCQRFCICPALPYSLLTPD